MVTNVQKLLTVSIFIVLFMSVGWLAPAMYAAYAPQDRLIQVNQFEPQDATVDADSHVVCWDRDIYREATGDVVTELYLIDDNGHRTEIDVRRSETYFEQDNVTSIVLPLPEQKRVGKYEYQAVITMELANGRIDRSFSFTSDTFEITEEADQSTQQDLTCE